MTAKIKELFNGNNTHILISLAMFVGVLIVVFLVYQFVMRKVQKRVLKTSTLVDDLIADLLKLPVLWLLFWIIFKIFSTYSFISNTSIFAPITKINNLLLIATIGWILIKGTRILFYYLEHKVETETKNIYSARTNLTKMKIFEGIIVAVITVLTVAACLMTFDSIRSIGISLLTSAGIAGIIVGLAAQKSIGAILAGIQIAITQPIRLDDQVIVEGQSGNIEEINLTYVVVKLWDEKRLILPVNYFLDNPFQNWTRNNSNILGTVFLYTDYSLPVDAIRQQLTVILNNNKKWDQRVAVVQVTDSKESFMEIRILLSSGDSGASFDLQVEVRERMIDYIHTNYPGCFVKTRIIGQLTQSEENNKGNG